MPDDNGERNKTGAIGTEDLAYVRIAALHCVDADQYLPSHQLTRVQGDEFGRTRFLHPHQRAKSFVDVLNRLGLALAGIRRESGIAGQSQTAACSNCHRT